MKQVIINLEENSVVRCGDSHVIVTRAGIESNRIGTWRQRSRLLRRSIVIRKPHHPLREPLRLPRQQKAQTK